jgi:hypothetical protein
MSNAAAARIAMDSQTIPADDPWGATTGAAVGDGGTPRSVSQPTSEGPAMTQAPTDF